MIGHCKACRHWDNFWRNEQELGTCERIHMMDKDTHIENDGAFFYVKTLDDSGLSVEFKTCAMFGCWAFEKEED
jgi:hypothetical protein